MEPALLSVRYPILANDSRKHIRIMTLTCGMFCLIGSSGAMLTNGKRWDAALLSCGRGTVILCIRMQCQCSS